MTGWNSTLNASQRAGDAAGDRLGVVDRVELGHHLSRDQLGGGDQDERHHHRDQHRHPMAGRVAEGALENVGERRLGERADRDRGHRHADLNGGDVFVDAVELAQRERRPARAFVAHDLQARPARAHERVLGGDEEGVDRDQYGREYELQPVHAGSRATVGCVKRRALRRGRPVSVGGSPVGAKLLRGGLSSSFIGGRPHNRSRGAGRLSGGAQSRSSMDAGGARRPYPARPRRAGRVVRRARRCAPPCRSRLA